MSSQRRIGLHTGERQVAPSLSGIRRDHTARYEWAAKLLKRGCVLDLACGVGYGTHTLATFGHAALGIDIDTEALDYAREHYAGAGATFARADADCLPSLGTFDAVVCFETVEHVRDPAPMLMAFRNSAPMLLASVPNQDVFPYTGQKFHFRHYTKAQFEALLNDCGWEVTGWFTQPTTESPVVRGDDGWTLIAVCTRGAFPDNGMLEVA